MRRLQTEQIQNVKIVQLILTCYLEEYSLQLTEEPLVGMSMTTKLAKLQSKFNLQPIWMNAEV